MSRRTGAGAWALCAAAVALLTLGLGLVARNEPDSFFSFASLAVPFMAYPLVGAFVASRRPANPIGWIFCAVGLTIGLWFFGGQYAVYSLLTAPDVTPGGVFAAVVGEFVGETGWDLITMFLPLLFPDGRLLSPRWRAVAWAAATVIALQTAADVFSPGPFTLVSFGSRVPLQANPLGLSALAGVAPVLSDILQILSLGVVAICVISPILRFRQARGRERQQLKWFALAALPMALIFVATTFLAAPSGTQFPPVTDLWRLTLGVATAVAIAAFPVATGLAIVRYHLYDLDRLINRTLVYTMVTALLLLVYFSSVLLFEQVLRPFTGQGAEPAIVASTLLIAGLFNPVRVAAQRFIDRRFYRHKYDATRTLQAFSATLRDEVDLDELAERLTRVVGETMQPSRLSLWLCAPSGRASRAGRGRD